MTVFHAQDQFADQRVLINLDGNHRLTAIHRLNAAGDTLPITEIPRVKIVRPVPGVSVSPFVVTYFSHKFPSNWQYPNIFLCCQLFRGRDCVSAQMLQVSVSYCDVISVLVLGKRSWLHRHPNQNARSAKQESLNHQKAKSDNEPKFTISTAVSTTGSSKCHID